MTKFTDYGQKMSIGKELAAIFRHRLTTSVPREREFNLNKTYWIFPHIVWGIVISRVPTSYTDSNKSGKAGYRSQNLNKVVQSLYYLLQKPELFVILMVLMDFLEHFSIVTDLQCVERVVLHI